MEHEFPRARTASTRVYLDVSDRSIGREHVTESSVSYDATGEGVTLTTAPWRKALK